MICMETSTVIVYGDVFIKGHKPWYPHPENPSRLRRIINSVLRYGLKNKVDWDKPVNCSKEELYRVHVKGYVDYIERLVAKAPAEVDPDTYVVEDTMETALYAFGTAINYAIKSIETRKKYILLVRPPGHHVGREGKAMGAATQGFCIFNNIAGAAKTLLDHGVSSIAILDIDAHHGNGTQEIFYKDDHVLHIDIHQDPLSLYPYTGKPGDIGAGKGEGYTINFILPPMCGDDCFNEIVPYIVDILKLFDPEIVLVSIGFDGYKDDGMTELRYTSNTFYKLGKLLNNLNKPLVSVLEGGYTVGLDKGFAAFVLGLLNEKDLVRDTPTKTIGLVKEKAEKYLNETINNVNKYWRLK